MKELGYPAVGFSASGLIAMAKIPDAAATVLEQACAKAAVAPAYVDIVERMGALARYQPGAEFRKTFEQDSAVKANAIKRAGLGNSP